MPRVRSEGKKLVALATRWAREGLRDAEQQDQPKQQPAAADQPAFGSLQHLLAKTAAAGIKPTDASAAPDDGPAYLWPECVPAWDAFQDLTDQWRDGVLPRADVLAHLRELFTDDAERRDVYECVCACARAVRRVQHEAAEARRKRDAQQRRGGPVEAPPPG